AGLACFAPLLALGPTPPAQIWPYVLGSALVEAVYLVALTFAYEHGEFSLVYPVARGAAPAFLALWEALFLGERLLPSGLAGLGLLVLGLVVVGGGVWWSRRGRAAPGRSAAAAALGVACCISIYSAIDGAAVRLAD